MKCVIGNGHDERAPVLREESGPARRTLAQGQRVSYAGLSVIGCVIAVLLAGCGWGSPSSSPQATGASVQTDATSSLGGLGGGSGLPDSSPQPIDAVSAVVRATATYPLIGLGEVHLNQQFHDFLGELLPKLPGRVNDVVVEFGNAHYQDVADRFILDLEPVGSEELAQIWRTAIGGLVLWDAPVYEQFFRSMRTLNSSLPAGQRIRVLLGDPDVDWSQIRTVADRDKIPTEAEREPFFAGVVEHEVLARGHHALLVVGGDHLRRGEYASPGGFNPSPDTRQADVATLLSDANPGSLYVIFPLAGRSPGSPDITMVDAAFADWPRPSIASVAGTWLGDVSVPYRLLDTTNTQFGRQVDAVLWLGPEGTLTDSLPAAALYTNGSYADELRRRSAILSDIAGQPVDLNALGLQLAAGGGRAGGKGPQPTPTG